MGDNDNKSGIDWPKAQSIFGAASKLPAGERAEFVRSECAGDGALENAVNELLAASEHTGDAIGHIVGEAAAYVASGRAGEAALPQAIGPYRILSLIGTGGMGRVLLAERDDEQFRQKVAIKVLGTRIASAELIRRFRTERQILANLNHPNIARLLDGGETEDGLPYLVMEHVEGQSLLAYCDSEQPGLEQRLTLFLRVCDAVQHAHQNFVIHRDIKSSNVMVAADGTVKLLDFGIAKLLQTDLSMHTVAETQVDARVMTPANASPEQLTNDPVTTATDVYGLGLLLYELLTGFTAYELSGTTRHELERAIIDTTPTRPSLRSDTATAAGTTTHGGSLARIRRRLAGDLDTIIMKALRKEPDRRYSTVRELADDIERYLHQEPVQARSEGFVYWARKFVARNRAAVLGALAVVVVAGGLTLFYTQQITAERDRADLRAEEAEQTSQFLIDLLNGANRTESSDRTTVDELLNEASARVEAELAGVPDLQSKLHFVIADAFGSVENYEKSFLHHEKALAYLRELPETRDRNVRYSRIAQSLSILYREHGDYTESESLSLEVLALNERIFEPTEFQVSYGLNKHGQILFAQGRYDEARDFLERAVEVGLAGVGENNEFTADAMNNLAIVYSAIGDFEKTEEYYARALAANRAILPRTHPNLANSIANFGLFLNNVQRYADARPYLEESLALRRETFAGVKSRQVALGAESLGTNLTWLGEFDEASALLHEALELTRDVLGPEHPTTARRHRNLARLYLVLEDYDKSLEHYLETRRIYLANFGDAHPSVYRAHQDVGRAALGLGRYDEAEAALSAGYAGMVEFYGVVNASNYPLQKSLGDLYFQTGELDLARRYYNESIASCEEGYGPDQPCQTNAMLGLAALHGIDGNHEAQRMLLESAIEIRQAGFGADSWFTAEARLAHCEALTKVGSLGEAVTECTHNYDVLMRLFGSEDLRTQRAAAVLTD